MTKRPLSFIAISLVLITQPASVIVTGTQQPKNTQIEGSAGARKKTVKAAGWRIPGLDQYKTVATVVERDADGTKVLQKVFASDVRPIVDLDGETVGNIDKKGINVSIEVAQKKKRLFDVRYLSAYEANGRIFAYGVTLVPLVIERRIRTYAGAMDTFFFYDEDGDGSFETRYPGLPMPGVPKWAQPGL